MAIKVLIADDSRLMRTIIRNALAPAGFEVVGEAKNGREAIDMYFQFKPDVVTMDMNMPETDGMTAIKEIVGKDSGARILVVSSLSQEAIDKEAVSSGAKAVLGKPFQANDLVNALSSLLRIGSV